MLRAVGVLIVCALALSGCGSSGGDAGGGAGTGPATGPASAPNSSVTASADANADLVAKLPSDVRQSGELTFATNATFKPYEFYPEGSKTLEGMDIDIANAVSAVLGLRAKFSNVSFDGIVAGVGSGQYQIAISKIGDTKAREDAVDFIDYLQDTTSLVTPAGNPKKININDMCGYTIGAEAGSTQATQMLPDLTKKCTDAGEPAIDVKTYPGGAASNLAVATGRADGLIVSSGQAKVVADNSSGKLEAQPERILPKPYGIVVKKGSPLAEPILGALKVIAGNGTYEKILDKWGQSDMRLDEFKMNGAIY